MSNINPHLDAYAIDEIFAYKGFLRSIEGVPIFNVFEPSFIQKAKLEPADSVVVLKGEQVNPYLLGYVGARPENTEFIFI